MAAVPGDASLTHTPRTPGSAVFEWDTANEYGTGSPERDALYGCAPGAVATRAAVLAVVHPDDRALVRGFFAELDAARHGDILQCEYRAAAPQGGVRWLRNVCRVEVSAGRRHISGVLSDVTEGKRGDAVLALSERRYRLLAEYIGTVLWQATPDGFITHALGWTTLTGQQEGEYQGHGWIEAVHPDDRPVVAAAWRRSCAAGQPVDVEYRARSVATGEWVWLRARTVPVHDDQGRLIEWSGICENIDQRRRDAAALAAAKDRAEQQDRAKSKFLAAASHDLRQPIQSLYLLAAALEPHVRPEGAAARERLCHGLDVLSRVLNGMLDLSRLDLDLVVPRPRDFPIGELLEDVAAGYAQPAQAKGLALRVVACAPAMVRTDPDMLRRLLANLVENAVRYSERGEVTLGCAQAGGAVVVSVRDQGIGIPPGQLDLIWEEFRQLANPARERRVGMGLGLSIVRRLSALLDCPVGVDSTPGQGTAFTVTVPLAAAAAPPAVVPALPERPVQPPAAVRRARPPAILVVDDDPLVRESFELMVESWGSDWLVQVAGSVAEAMALRCPDAVVMDYRLGEETGDAAMARLRAHWRAPGLPGVLLTGDTDAGVAARARASAMRLLHKPVDTRRLRDVLAAMLAEA
ncbi:Histidine kinase [Rhodovastum atsumiense]|uniref:histidine kinase n=1 Tax=Rhodovastum atsumiense TaxID=504468 RepID=A0A5M6IJK6_9PROT|nr:PAS domain-containing protein [Rhodovastum atsumiense]KAA5608067.1 PAS domain-containing protein [Rhodovastum atsumiense]CAH2602623.1 Histidine kinase [Rhodovastum atsumiense]